MMGTKGVICLMNKQEFLDRLTRALAPLPYVRRQQIVEEFRHKFDERLAAGMAESEICAALGEPEACAQPYLAAAQSAQYTYTQNPPPQYGYAPPQGQVPYQQTVQADDRIGYIIGLILAVIFLAVPFVPGAFGMILAGVLVFFAAFTFFPVAGLAVFGAFLIALAVLLISISVLILYGIVALIAYLVRKISGKPDGKGDAV